MKKFVVVIITLAAASVAHAGYLELSNGDRAEGEFVRIEGDSVVWKSENFGELHIKKDKIKNIVTSNPLKISGNDIPCMVEGMENEDLMYYCGLRSHMVRTPLLTIKTMTPYEDYVEGQFLHHGKISLFGAYSRGNEIRDEWNIQGDMTLRRSEFRHTFAAEYSSASWDHSDPPTKWNAKYGLDWFFRERWFWSNNVEIGVDESRGVENYQTLGSAAGYQFWENSRTALSLKAGLSYFSEEYTIPEMPDENFIPEDRYTAWRLATDFRYTLPFGISLFHTDELLQSLEDSDDFYLKTSTGLNAMILSKIYSEIKVDYNYDNEPQPDTQAKDLRTTVGVSYKW